MAFLQAVTTEYRHILNADLEDIGIAISGTITDDAIPEVHVATCYILGEQYQNLTPADPALDGTPDDPRYQEILTIVHDFVAAEYARWTADYAARQSAEASRLAMLAAFPKITSLPSGSL